MLHLYLLLVSIALILYGENVLGELIAQDITTEKGFAYRHETCYPIAAENDMLKATIENLKIRLELQEVSHELKLIKMEKFVNENKTATNPHTLLEMQKTLIEPILMKLDTLVNAIKNEDNLHENDSRKRNDELLKVLNRIDLKLNSINNHTMEGNRNIDQNSESNNESHIEGFSNCADALAKTQQSGIYTINGGNYGQPFQVYCDGNRIVIQRRQDGSVDFYRNWFGYKNGFGDLNGEFFIGLDKLYALTSESPQELLIELEDFENDTRYAKYDLFAIGSEIEDYAINILGNYSGDAGDSLSFHKNLKFSTKDRNNQDNSDFDCATKYKGGWWYKDKYGCFTSNLNGLYLRNNAKQDGEGIVWYYWKNLIYSLKRVQMLIRPKAL